MAATLSLARKGIGVELRRGTFEILVDGTPLGSLDAHETFETAIEPGRHTLRIRAGRYSSHSLAFDVADGGLASFRCHGAMVWPRYVASVFKPDLGIALKAV